MNRAELRRKQREDSKKTATYTLTREQIESMKKQVHDKAVQEIFTLMLAIPCEILANEYWEKTAKQRMPKFIEQCLSLYKAYEQGVVTLEQMEADLWELAGYKVERGKE